MSPWKIRADDTLRRVNFTKLLSVASTQRGGGEGDVKIVELLIRYGGSHVVVPIKFRDGKLWAARLANQGCSLLLAKSLIVLDHVAKHCPRVPAPRVQASGVLDTNSVGVGYLLLDWIDGVSVEHWSPEFPLREHCDVLLDGLADCLLSLWSCTTERNHSPPTQVASLSNLLV
jgi:hypothetical protein